MTARLLAILNAPQMTDVWVDTSGIPISIVIRRRRHRVVRLIDRWLVEEGWWREAGVQRLYFRVELEMSRELVVYCDLITKQWWLQRDG